MWPWIYKETELYNSTMYKEIISQDLKDYIESRKHYFESKNINGLINELFKVPTEEDFEKLKKKNKERYLKKLKHLELGKEILNLVEINPNNKRNIFSEKLYCLWYEVKPVKCKYCEDYTLYLTFKKGYKEACQNKECIDRKRKETNIKKYGFACVTKNSEVQKKSRKTWALKSEEEKKDIRERIERTKKIKHTTPKDVKEKNRKTMLERYGVPHSWQTEKANEARKKTLHEKYGGDYTNPFSVPQVIEKLVAKRKIRERQNGKKWIEEQGKGLYKFIDIVPDPTGVYSRGLYKIKCNECGRIFYMTRGKLRFLFKDHDGKVCLACHPRQIPTYSESQGEKELKKYIMEELQEDLISRYYFNIKKDERKNYEGIKGFELDAYLDKRNIGFEFNGIYWHSLNKVRSINYHKNKKRFFDSMNINLSMIWDFNFNKEREKTNNYVKLILEKNENIKFDSYKEISKKEGFNFIEENEICYDRKSCDRFVGLFKNSELIGVISYEKENVKFITSKIGYYVENALDAIEKGSVGIFNLDYILPYDLKDKEQEKLEPALFNFFNYPFLVEKRKNKDRRMNKKGFIFSNCGFLKVIF